MGMRSTIRKLSSEDLDELHKRVRASWYSDLDQHAEWARGKGYDISRSSLHRYIGRLREADKEGGSERATIAVQRTNAKQQRRMLLERLGALRLEEIRLVEQLKLLEEVG